MRRLLAALPFLALVLGAAETVMARAELPWRPRDPALAWQASLLWLALGALALAPAWLTLRLLRRRDRSGPWPPAVLLGWMALPIAVHGVLDRHTQLGGATRGLASARTALEVGATLAVGLALLWILARLLRGLRGRALAALAAGAALLAATLLPPRAAAQPAPARDAGAGAGRPNLLLLVWDTCRSDRLQPYGFERPTSPGLADLAQQSVVFERSLSTSVFTFTSHLSLLTGVYPSTHGARLLRMRYDPTRATSIATTLRAAGYRTGAFVGTDVLAGRTGLRDGFERYDDQVDPPVCDTRAWQAVHDVQTLLAARFPGLRNNGEPHWFQRFQRPAGAVLARALAWLREDDPRPWFCFVNLYDVHWPYVPDERAARELVGPYAGAVDGYLFRSDRWRAGQAISEDDRRHVRELYEAEIRQLDGAVSGFLDALALERGGTAVLVTADHGEAFGERDQWYHEDIGEVQVRVPFLVRRPEPAPQGERRRTPVSGVDVAPTLLALAGLPPPEDMEGRDALALPEDAPRTLFVEDRDHPDPRDVRIALYEQGYKLVRHGLGSDARYELYDLSHDPGALHDLAAERPDVLARLRALLDVRRAAFDEEEAQQAADGGLSDALYGLGYADTRASAPVAPGTEPGSGGQR